MAIPAIFWLPTFFKISSFVLSWRKKRIQVWNNRRVDDDHIFWVNYSLKLFWQVKKMENHLLPSLLQRNVTHLCLSEGPAEEFHQEEGKLASSTVAFQVKFCDTLRL